MALKDGESYIINLIMCSVYKYMGKFLLERREEKNSCNDVIKMDQKFIVRMCTEFIWLRAGASGRIL